MRLNWSSRSLPGKEVLLFLGAHVLVAQFANTYEILATLHAVGTFGLTVWWALEGRIFRVACCCMYIAGAEVFWRMGDALVPWEFAKYSIVFVSVLVLIRTRRIGGPALPLAYLLLLVPGAFLTMSKVDVATAKDLLSFNLSGPLALAVVAVLFSNLQLTRRRMMKLLFAGIAPIIAVASYVIFDILEESLNAIVFLGESNAAMSGGFGPNQVSSVLGLGAVLLLLFLVIGKTETHQKLLMSALVLLLISQSALTFSRSGLALALGSTVAAGVFLFLRSKTAMSMVVLGGVVAIFAYFVLVPSLNTFTKSAFEDRFTSTTTTHRAEIALGEIRMWQENPVFGVGVGMGSEHRVDIYGFRTAAHTEFTRLVAEHGIFGLSALLLLSLALTINLIRAGDAHARALIAAFVTYSYMFMLVNAFRLAVPACLIGITFAMMRFGTDGAAQSASSDDF